MNQDHVFLEMTTSHPNPSIGEIVSIAAVRTDRKGNVVAAFMEKVHVKRPPIHDEFQEYDELEWSNAHNFDEVSEGLEKVICEGKEKRFVVVTHSETPRQFLKAYKSKLFGNRPWIDIRQVAWPLIFNDIVKSSALDSLCTHFGIPVPEKDTAAGNCETIVRVYWTMMNHYHFTLAGGEMVQQFGQEAFSGVRRLFGM